MDRIAFGKRVAEELDNHGVLVDESHEDKIAAAAAIHDELHSWAAEHFPVGCSAEMSEEHLKRGLKAVRNKFAKLSDRECRQSYGFPVLLVLGLIPTLVSWISMLWKLWKPE